MKKGSDMEKVLGLCVGINKFKRFPESSLNGCISDANAWYNVLKKSFRSDDISWLIDTAATKKNIMNILADKIAIVNSYKTASRLWFTLSSHGSQQTDVSGDENDGLDECFICYDSVLLGKQFDPNSIILDDELWEMFGKVRKSCLVEVVLDTCHSGTGLRLLNGNRRRFLENPFVTGKTIFKRKKRHNQHPNVILWAGCKANESSLDAYIDGEYHGAATFALMQSIAASKMRSDILKSSQRWLNDNDLGQTLQLECEDKHKKAVMFK